MEEQEQKGGPSSEASVVLLMTVAWIKVVEQIQRWTSSGPFWRMSQQDYRQIDSLE